MLKAVKKLSFIPAQREIIFVSLFVKNIIFTRQVVATGVLWHTARIHSDLKVWSWHCYKPYFKTVGSCRFITGIYLYGLKCGPLLQDSTQGLIHLWWEIFSFQPALNQSEILWTDVCYIQVTLFLQNTTIFIRRIYQR